MRPGCWQRWQRTSFLLRCFLGHLPFLCRLSSRRSSFLDISSSFSKTTLASLPQLFHWWALSRQLSARLHSPLNVKVMHGLCNPRQLSPARAPYAGQVLTSPSPPPPSPTNTTPPTSSSFSLCLFFFFPLSLYLYPFVVPPPSIFPPPPPPSRPPFLLPPPSISPYLYSVYTFDILSPCLTAPGS